MLVLNHLGELAQECGLTDTGHVLQTDFLGASLYQLVGDIVVIFKSMYGRCSYTQSALGNHAALLGPLDRGLDIANVVQTVKDTGDVGTLLGLDLVHQSAYIVGHGIHAQRVETAVKHVGLDAHLIERLAECAHGVVRILAGQKVHLLKGTTVGLHATEATHLNDYRSDALQLVLAWLELTRALPHISIHETELNFLLHIIDNIFNITIFQGAKLYKKNQLAHDCCFFLFFGGI